MQNSSLRIISLRYLSSVAYPLQNFGWLMLLAVWFAWLLLNLCLHDNQKVVTLGYNCKYCNDFPHGSVIKLLLWVRMCNLYWQQLVDIYHDRIVTICSHWRIYNINTCWIIASGNINRNVFIKIYIIAKYSTTRIFIWSFLNF